MKRITILIFLVLFGTLFASCSAAVVSSPESISTGNGVAGAPANQIDQPGFRSSGQAYWELDSLQAFDFLLSKSDGYTYYYIFENVPKGLEVKRIGLEPDFNHYNITFKNDKGEVIQFYVFSNLTNDNIDKFNKISVDGKEYYYHQRFSNGEEGNTTDGELVISYFMWEYDGKVFLVHPKEPITPDLIRKYNKVKKVEFNIGKSQVGLDTRIDLVGSMDKIKSIIKENKGIKYHKGYIKIGETDDILIP